MTVDELVRRFPKYRQWELGEKQATLRQLEEFAKVVHVPIGYLFLSKLPDESNPIPDFRTIGQKGVRQPSPDLLDTLYVCQLRQDWFREFAAMEGEGPLPFIASESIESDVEEVAAKIRSELNLDNSQFHGSAMRKNFLKGLIAAAESIGILVMVSGIVGNNSRRKLDPKEFRGFALVDKLAPLIFINGADTKAAQLFTLTHELAHLWLGKTALSDLRMDKFPSHNVEKWCNRVSAEILVPHAILIERQECQRIKRRKGNLMSEVEELRKYFMVSTLVILRRLYDIKVLKRTEFEQHYNLELEKILGKVAEGGKKKSGGDFLATQKIRLGNRFARAVVRDTLEGRTLYRDALYLLGFSSLKTFDKLADEVMSN